MLHSTLPYWIAIPPLVLVLPAVWRRFSSSPGAAPQTRMLSWLPGVSSAVREHRLAAFAQSLASLLEAGVPLPEALRLAAGHWEDAALDGETRLLAAALERGQTAADASGLTAELPPFLRWAIWQADEAVGRPRALRMAAEIYRQSAERRIQRLEVILPVVGCLVIGGGVTLLYGLALFVPVAQMLRGLAG
jgi:type II secretory pathway component PulF